MTTRVLLTQGLSNVHYAIKLVHKAMAPREFHLAASCWNRYTPISTVADTFIVEPKTGDDGAYIQWLLDLCHHHQFTLLWPQSRLTSVFVHRQLLADAGITVLLSCNEQSTLDIINDKAGTASALFEHGIALPQWKPFKTAAELDFALAALGYPRNRICIKPAVSICAQGFRILDDSRDPFVRLMQNDTTTIGTNELKALLTRNDNGIIFLAMEYLAGDERSIDCLVSDGILLQSVTRRKPKAARGHWEIIEADPEGQAIATKVCQIFRLNGLINIQTRERILPAGGRMQCLLEVNARMSGGINMACESGFILPYWALRLAAGTATPADIPAPRHHLMVTIFYQALTIEDLSAVDFPSLGQDSVDAIHPYEWCVSESRMIISE
jgi:carbamoylphosphate synthase large subunit